MKIAFSWNYFLQNKYNLLLIGLILLLVFSPTMASELSKENFPFFSMILLFVLASAIKSNFPNSKYLYFFMLIVGAAFVFKICRFYLPEKYSELIENLIVIDRLISCIFLGFTAYKISVSLFRTRNVTSETIKGGICVYLILGFFWAILYSLCDQLIDNSFIHFNNGKIHYIYFSFVTLTTVGYGDITPVNHIACVLSNIEAIAGQCFLTIFIARLVGLHISEKREHSTLFF